MSAGPRHLAAFVLSAALSGYFGAAEAARPDPFPASDPPPADRIAAQEALVQATQLFLEVKLDEAAERARAAGSFVPTAVGPHALLGMILEQQSRTQEAIDEYREALAWQPDESRALAALERLGAPRYLDKASQYEAELLNLVNQAREREGLSRLKAHPVLAEVARGHSTDMRDLSFFDHLSPRPGCRAALDRFRKRFDGEPRFLGENIARRWRRPESAFTEESIVASHGELMMSTGHRRNILHRDFVYCGVGIATNEEGDYWITEVFMTPRPATLSSLRKGKP